MGLNWSAGLSNLGQGLSRYAQFQDQRKQRDEGIAENNRRYELGQDQQEWQNFMQQVGIEQNQRNSDRNFNRSVQNDKLDALAERQKIARNQPTDLDLLGQQGDIDYKAQLTAESKARANATNTNTTTTGGTGGLPNSALLALAKINADNFEKSRKVTTINKFGFNETSAAPITKESTDSLQAAFLSPYLQELQQPTKQSNAALGDILNSRGQRLADSGSKFSGGSQPVNNQFPASKNIEDWASNNLGGADLEAWYNASLKDKQDFYNSKHTQ